MYGKYAENMRLMKMQKWMKKLILGLCLEVLLEAEQRELVGRQAGNKRRTADTIFIIGR